MMINLNKQIVDKYKKDIGITQEYKGPLNLFTWEDELSYLEDIVEDEIEEDLAEYEYEDAVNSDMEDNEEDIEEDSEVEED